MNHTSAVRTRSHGAFSATSWPELEEHVRTAIALTGDSGVPASHREAAYTAILGALCQDGVPITLAQVTGVREPAPIAGAWIYPSPG